MPPLPTLRRRADFDAVMRSGTARSHRILVLRWRHTDRAETRIGLSTPRSIGGAVVRNRVRRRLREIVRERLGDIGAGYDLLLIARPDAAGASFAELRSALATLLERAGIG
ncbi:MAG TPA: ribonuclease P protein component [Candidatus Limnocylindria bacterium]|nr:ribonuclease P protein component [Candidatus Limnocylindria bacterium]